MASMSSFGNLYHLNAEDEPEMPDYPLRTQGFASVLARVALSIPGLLKKTTPPGSYAGDASAGSASRTQGP